MGLEKQCEINFKDVTFPSENILGEQDKGWDILSRTLEMAMVGKCAQMLGGMKACTELTNRHVKQRRAYGRTIADFQVIQHYLADMWLKVETSGNITYEAAWHIARGLPATIKASVAKAWVGQAFAFVTERAVQMHGAIGMTREHDVGLYYRQARPWDLSFGDAYFQKEILGKELGFLPDG